jgi:hypothetical protein
MLKRYQVSVTRDGKKVHMNHFIQELTASSVVGLLAPLGAVEGDWKNVTVSIEQLAEPVEVVGRESK